MRIKARMTGRVLQGGQLLRIMGVGRIRVISTSKIRKITATKKKRKEKGRRADLLGSNPHSKGLPFSRSRWDFLEIRDAITIRAVESTRVRTRAEIINNIVRLKRAFNYSFEGY